MARRLASLLIAAVAAMVLGACSGSPAPVAGPTAAPSGPPVDNAANGIEIPKLAVTSGLVVTGIQLTGPHAGELEVPPTAAPEQASYYRYAPIPGDVGPALVLGHINGGGRDGVFARLPELVPGDEVWIDRPSGRVRFTVTDSRKYPKDEFPWAAVASPVNAPELRLVTCTGAFVGGDKGYADNLIVSARMS